MRGGAQGTLARLEQILSASKPPADEEQPVKKKLPVDRSLGFASEASRLINGALVACEEHYPLEGAHTVLLAVVEREPAQYHERLKALHTEYFADRDPLSLIHLEVVDRNTHEAIERLIATGVIAPTRRAVRPLLNLPEEPTPQPLSEAERSRVTALQDQAARKLKMGRVLGEAGLTDETRSPLLEAIHLQARALAVAHRLPDPPNLDAALLPPLALHFGESLPSLQSFAGQSDSDWRIVADALSMQSKYPPIPEG